MSDKELQALKLHLVGTHYTKTLCNQNTSGGQATTRIKAEVDCLKCLTVMKKFGLIK